MLPRAWAERLRPPPRGLVVERDEQPDRYGAFIIIPERVRHGKRSHLATIIAVGEEVEILEPGDRVVLAAGVGHRFDFGPEDVRTLWVCRPSEILCVLVGGDDVTKPIEAQMGRFPFVPNWARQLDAAEDSTPIGG